MSERLHPKVSARRHGRHDARLDQTVKRKTLTESVERSCVGIVLFKETRIGCQRFSAVIWSAVGGAIFAGTFGFASNGKEDLSKDPDYREELGVNEFTAPSIDKVFATLDALKPIPFDAVTRPVNELNTNDRSKYALAFGVLIGDGFLDVAAERDQDLPALGRELIRRAKGLGVGERATRHSKRLLDLAQAGAWDKLRKELSVTQADVENAMLALHDEPLAQLLSLGGWLRGLEIGAQCVVTSFSAERAERLRNRELLNYYLDRLDSLAPRFKKNQLIQKITAGLQTVEQCWNDAENFGPSQVARIYEIARDLINQIEQHSS
jgi:hypothetical protein